MNRRALLAVALAVLLALSGCSALPMWDEGGPSPTPTPTEATSDSVPDADPDAEGGEGPDVAYPDGYGPSGVEDSEAALATHVGALVDSESYIFSYDSLIREGDNETVFTYQQYVDQTNEAGYVIRDTADGTVVEYYEDGQVYVRAENGSDTQYGSSEADYEMSEFTGFQFVGPLLENVEYRDAEVIETDEGTFYRYVSEEVTDPGAILRSDVEESRIDRFDVSIVVDENGVVRQGVFVVEADRDITVTMGVSELNSTNVDRPEWYDEAANS